jgi:predicted ATPase
MLNLGMVPRIVITGAPASGKTEVFNRLKKDPALANFVFFDELARLLLSENPEYRKSWSDFHIEIYHRQVAREKQVVGQPFITDRGTVDAFAFHLQTMEDVNATLEEEYQRYSAVVQLGSSADLGNKFYERNGIRKESISEALAIEKAITELWRRHPGYHFVKAETDFEKKYHTFLQVLMKLV